MTSSRDDMELLRLARQWRAGGGPAADFGETIPKIVRRQRLRRWMSWAVVVALEFLVGFAVWLRLLPLDPARLALAGFLVAWMIAMPLTLWRLSRASARKHDALLAAPAVVWLQAELDILARQRRWFGGPGSRVCLAVLVGLFVLAEAISAWFLVRDGRDPTLLIVGAAALPLAVAWWLVVARWNACALARRIALVQEILVELRDDPSASGAALS